MKSCTTASKTVSVNRSAVLIFLVIAAIFLYLRTFLLPATPLAASGDEVHYFFYALRILHGLVPYRDFYTFVPPGTDLLYAGIFRLFGIHQWVSASIGLVLGLLLTASIVWVSACVLGGALIFLPALLFLVFDYTNAFDATHHWWSTLFLVAAVGVLLDGMSDRRIFAAGTLCGVATLFTQTQGGLGLAAIAVFVILCSRDEQKKDLPRRLAVLFLPCAILVFGFAGYYASRAGLSTLAYWTIYFPIVFFPAQANNTPLRIFFEIPLLHGVSNVPSFFGHLLIRVITPLAPLVCLIQIARRRGDLEEPERKKILLISLVGLALFASVMTRATPERVCEVAPLAVVLLVWYLSGPFPFARWIRAALWTMGVILVVFLPIKRQLQPRVYLDLPTGRVGFVNPHEYAKLQWLAQQTHPGEAFFGDPLIAFCLGLKSPGPMDLITPTDETRPEQVALLLQDLTAYRTRYIYMRTELFVIDSPRNNMGPFWKYLSLNYHLATKDAEGQVWERN